MKHHRRLVCDSIRDLLRRHFFTQSNSDQEAQRRVLEAADLKEKSLSKVKSVLFWTTHKCASSFMGDFFIMVDTYSSLKHINYAQVIDALGSKLQLEMPYSIESMPHLYFPYGELYGPLRTPFDFPGRSEFNNIFFLRDPRDLLISLYYSRAYTHAIPQHPAIRREFLVRRQDALEMGIDMFCLRFADEWILPHFAQYQQLREASYRAHVFTYDSFLEDKSLFVSSLCGSLGVELPRPVLEKFVISAEAPFSSPQTQSLKRHTRSGKSRQFEQELEVRTVDILNNKLRDLIMYWGFVM